MAKKDVFKKEYVGSLDNLENNTKIKAPIIGGISARREILIEISADVKGGIDAPWAEIIIQGWRFKRVKITGRIRTKKLFIKHAEVYGPIEADEINISDTITSDPVTAHVKFL